MKKSKTWRVSVFVFLFAYSLYAQTPEPILEDTKIVAKIVFEGNRTFRSKDLLKVISLRPGKGYAERKLAEDLQSLELFYKNQGFLSVKLKTVTEEVQVKNRRGIVIHFSVAEGPRARIGSLSFSGFSPFFENRLYNQLTVGIGDLLLEDKLRESEENIVTFYKNSGYPFAMLNREIALTDSLAQVNFIISEGPKCFIQEIAIRGNLTVKSSVIYRNLSVKPGQVFSQEKLYQSQRQLFGTRLFERVVFSIIERREPGAQNIKYPDSSLLTPLVIRFDVVELPARGIGLGLGYSTPPDRMLFSLEWEDVNFLQENQNLGVFAEFTPNFQGEFRNDLNGFYRIPYLFRTPLTLFTQPFLNWEKTKNSRRIDFGAETGVRRNFGFYLQGSLLNRYKKIIARPNDTTLTGQGITNSLIFNTIYDSRNDFFVPYKGVYISPTTELAGSFLKGTNDFWRNSFEARIFKRIFGEDWVIALRLASGWIIPFGRLNRIPYYEKFSIGARNNLRGYEEAAIGPDTLNNKKLGGDFLLNYNLEFRFPLYKNLSGIIFNDGGMVSNTPKILFSEFHFSLGFGLRFKTSVGPLRIDYGKRLKNPPLGDWGKIYFGVFNVF